MIEVCTPSHTDASHCVACGGQKKRSVAIVLSVTSYASLDVTVALCEGCARELVDRIVPRLGAEAASLPAVEKVPHALTSPSETAVAVKAMKAEVKKQRKQAVLRDTARKSRRIA